VINCVVCGEPTPSGTRGKPKKYCSIICKTPRKTTQPKSCLVCQKDLAFSNRGRTKLTCSRTCRDRKKASILKESSQVSKKCFRCSNQFTTGKKDQRFCSTPCRRAQHKEDNPHIRKTGDKVIVCGWCNLGVTVSAGLTTGIKYHDECRARAKRARYRIKTVKRQSLTAKPSRLSADELVDKMGSLCRICGTDIDLTLKRTSKMGLTVDHIIPLSKGGEDTLENMQPAHWVCNVRKGNKTDA